MAGLGASTTLSLSGSAVLGKTKNEIRLADNYERMRLRILDSKWRAIGIDKDALDQQVEEQARKKAAEDAEARRYDEALLEATAAAAHLEEMEALERLKEHAELRAAWRFQADRSDRREWDLSDPKQLSREAPPCTEDDFSNITASSIQVFESEFSDAAGKSRRLRREMDEANAEAIRLKREREAAEKAADAAEVSSRDELLSTLATRTLSETREAMSEDAKVAYENKRLAQERKAREALLRQEALEKEREHVANTMLHPMLTESRSQGYGFGGPSGRIRRDHYKGMSREEIEAIRAAQARQREENEARRRAEKEGKDDGGMWETPDPAFLAETARAVEQDLAADEAEKKRQYYLALKAQQREIKMRRRAEEEGDDPAWEGGLLDQFNKRGR